MLTFTNRVGILIFVLAVPGFYDSVVFSARYIVCLIMLFIGCLMFLVDGDR